jgi:hypothetical protein
MIDGEYWLMRPVLEGLCNYESLLNGALDLSDVSRMNEAIDVRNELRARVDDAIQAERDRF